MDLRLLANRKQLIDEISGPENMDRKARSLRQCEIFGDNLYQYVVEKLEESFSPKTVLEMPKVATINLAKRVVEEEAAVYKEPPQRSFKNLASDEQREVLDLIYQDMMADSMLFRSNQYFKLQEQNLIQILPKEGKLKMRVYKQHHYDVIPDPQDPERAFAYIFSSFDKDSLIQERGDEIPTGAKADSRPSRGSSPDRVNQSIADEDDYKALSKRFVVWTKRLGDIPALNFMMNGRGQIIDAFGSPITDIEAILNPIENLENFIDVAQNKDFEYFVRNGEMLTDFCIEYNAALSDLYQIVRMQGWSQAIVKGDIALMPENLQIGPNFILKLPVDPDNPVDTDFSYSSPSPDLSGSIQFIEMLLANFLSSRGISTKAVSGKAEGDSFSSGIERLLALVEKFEASKDDYVLYDWVEQRLFKAITSWHDALRDTDLLLDKYKSVEFGLEADINVQFSKPEMVQTKSEKADFYEKLMGQGLASRVTAAMDLFDMDREMAEQYILSIDQDELRTNLNGESEGPEAI